MMEGLSLTDKCAVVTGGSRGIGRAVCLELARLGARVVFTYAGNAEAAQKTVEMIEARGGAARAICADVRSAEDATRVIDEARGSFGGVDILVNNAGITCDKLAARMKPEDFDAVIDTNLKGAFLYTKAALRPMMRARSGAIVNMASVVGLRGNAGQANYAASKAGLIGMTKSIAREAASLGIRVNAVAPGFIATDMTDAMPEAAVTPLSIGGFTTMRALHTGDDPACASIPFDARRSGFVMGEGAGVCLLEELEHAQARGAHIYAELVGYGVTCDAFHITAPSENGEGAAHAMQLTLEDAGVDSSQVDYINAHGTSTKLNDERETQAVKTAFGEHATELAMSSTKSMTGHMLGAAGAVEAIFTALALHDSYLPATIGYQEADPACDLDYVTSQGRSASIEYAMSDSLGFGGHNACILMKAWKG